MKTRTKIIFKKVIYTVFIFFFISIWTLTSKTAPIEAATNTVTFTTAGTSSWTAPANVTSVDVEVWGAGGGGGSRTSGTNACGGGGGGGAYSKSTVTVTPGNSYSYTVGAAGSAGVNGGNSSFNTSSVIAEGGKGVPNNTTTGGSGGLASNSTGTTKYNGGSGYSCTSGGGGGGGSGGTGSAGNTPTSSSGASAVTGGGPGGDGGTITSAYGQAPSSGPGGGGGGGYRVFANRTGGSGYAGKVSITYTLYTVIGDGTDPSNSSIIPGAVATEIDRFSLSTNVGTDTVTGLTVTLGPSGAYQNIGTVSVQTTAGVAKCSTSTVTSNTVSLSSCAIAVTTSSTEYKILVTPKSHANMPSPPGSQPAVTATVTDWAGTNTHSGSDTNSATVTIDNLSPGNVSSATASFSNRQVNLSWTNPSDSDFTTSGKVIVLRRAAADVSDTPVEGTAYSVGNTIGSSTVVCVNAGSPPSTSCTDSNFPVDGTYYYKIFSQDANGNFSSGGTSPTGSPVTVDNTPPNSATFLSGTGRNAKIVLNWTTSNSSDFNTTSGSVIYRWTSSSAGSEVPTFGSTPSVGSTNSTATVACVVSSTTSTPQSKTDGSGGSADCTTAALTNGQAYTYKVFQKDNFGNYDAGTTIGTFTPTTICSSIATGNWSSGSTWTGACSGGNNQPVAGDPVIINAGHTVTVDSAQAADKVTISSTATLSFSSNSTLTLNGTTGTLLTNSGTFTSGSSSTVNITSTTAPTAILSGSFVGTNSFYDFTLSPTISGAVGYALGAAFTTKHNFTVDPTSSGSNTLTVTLGGTTTVTGNTLIQGETSALSDLNTGSNYAFASGTINITAAGTLTGNASTITLNGTTGPLFTRTGTFQSGTSTVIFSENSSDLTLTSGSLNFYNLQINLPGKTGTLGNTVSVGNNLSITTGTLADGGFQITGNTTGTLSLSISGILKLGAGTSTTFPTQFTNFSLVPGNTINFASNQDQNIPNSLSYSNLIISGTGTKTLSGNLSVGQNLTISSGTLSAGNYDIALAGNWTNTGTFSGGTGTVNLTGADNSTQIISGNTTFHHLTASTATNNSGRTIRFSGSSATTVSGNWQFSGTSDKILTLNSTNSSIWTVSPTNATLAFLSLAKSHNTVGTICVTNSNDDGDNEGYDIRDKDTCTDTPTATFESPLGYYKFDEGHSSTSHNSGKLGSKVSVNASNANWKNDGKFGKSLHLNGSGNYLSLSNDNDYNITADLAISAWIKPTSFGGNDFGRILDRSDGNKGYSLMLNGTNRSLRFSANGINIDSTANSVSLDTWQYVAVVRTGSTVTLYVNGLPVGSGTVSTINSSPNTECLVGNNNDNTAGFAGQIDELKIYNISLNANQIKLDLNHGAFLNVGTNSDSSTYCVPGDTAACSDPVGEWTFEEGQGNTTYDTSTNNNTGSFSSSSISWTAGTNGKALSFSGSEGQSVTVTDNSTLRLTTSGTLEVWLNPSSYPSSETIIISKGSFSTKRNLYALYENSTSLIFTLGGSLNNASIAVSNTLIPLNTWSHVTAVWDSNYLTLYINGRFQGQTATNGTPNTIGQNLYFGGGGEGNYFQGKLDSIRLYNTSRTPAQVAWDYNKGEAFTWWKLNECQGTSIHDSISSLHSTLSVGSDGSQTSTGSCSTSGSAWGNGATGKQGGSVRLDGTDDFISQNDSPSLRFSTQDFTISAWIKLAATNRVQGIVTKGDTGTGGYSLYIDSDNKPAFINQNSTVSKGITALSSGKWYHLVAERNGNDLLFFIDGLPSGSATNYFSGLDLNSTSTLYIGSRNATNYFNGQIDDVRFFNFALTAEQVLQVGNNGTASFN